MGRLARGELGDRILHILNRGNGRAQVFFTPNDYRNFIRLLEEAKRKFGVKIFAFCLMPNHFHLSLQCPREGPRRFVHWLTTTHVRRQHKRSSTSGHIWQDRYKSFVTRDDGHLYTILRYVLQNPVRASMVRAAHDWLWSSLHFPELVDPWPVRVPTDMREFLSVPVSQSELDQIHLCIDRDAPFGDPDWRAEMAAEGEVQFTLKPQGRPRHPEPSAAALRMRRMRSRRAGRA
jgi:putative transposase